MPSDELLKKIHKLLKELEWRSEGDHCSVCPSCLNCMHKHGSREGGHDPDCELAVTLALVEAESKLAVQITEYVEALLVGHKLADQKDRPQPTDGESYQGR